MANSPFLLILISQDIIPEIRLFVKINVRLSAVSVFFQKLEFPPPARAPLVHNLFMIANRFWGMLLASIRLKQHEHKTPATERLEVAYERILEEEAAGISAGNDHGSQPGHSRGHGPAGPQLQLFQMGHQRRKPLARVQ